MIARKGACVSFADPDVAAIARLGLTATDASAAIFFWVDSTMRIADSEIEGLSSDYYPAYLKWMEGLDPHALRKMYARQQRIVHLNPYHIDPRYAEFLTFHRVTDVVDLLFWVEGVPVAGLGLLKKMDEGSLSESQIATAAALQVVAERNLRYHERVLEHRRSRSMRALVRLTPREADTVDLIAKGMSNLEIAKVLNIQLPTVKMHVANALAKTGCARRSALVSWYASL